MITGKCWGAWKRIKSLCSDYTGLKIPSIVSLIKISVLPILFYAAPVWMNGNEIEVKKLWQDILKTTTATRHYHPSVEKMEILTSLPPLDIQVQIIITKFLIKNFYNHTTDLLKKEINNSRIDSVPGHFVKTHCTYLKEYIGHVKGLNRYNRIDLNYRELGPVKYTKATIWKFINTAWNRRISISNNDFDFTSLIQQKPRIFPCNRATESFLCSGILNRLPLFEFLKNRNIVDCSLCSCQENVETINHLMFECNEFEYCKV